MRSRGGGTRVRRALVLAAVIFLAGALLSAAARAGTSGPMAVPFAAAATGDRFTPVAPTRIYDAVQAAGQTSDVTVTGGSLRIPGDVSAVVLTLSGAAASAPLYVTAYPTPTGASPPPRVSQLNLVRGQTAADLITVAVGARGRIRLSHSAGSVLLVLDIAGYYSPSSPDTYVPVSPRRVYDSGSAAPLGQTTRTVSRAVLGLPSDATAVVVNLLVAHPTAATYLTVWPAGATRPRASALNVAKGETRADLVTVEVGAGGIDLFAAAGSARFALDVQGWYDTSVTGSTYVPVAPVRIDAGARRLGAGGTVDERLEAADHVPAGASAAVFTLTARRATAPTYEQAYATPAGSAVPTGVSTLDVTPGATAANLVIAGIGAGGDVRLRNLAGSVSDIVDLAGYFLAPPPGNDVSAHQCSDGGTGSAAAGLPARARFGVVNPTAGDLAFSGVNPCLAAEDQWARSTGDEAFYLALSDRGPSSTNWPGGSCSGEDTAACAYQFGANQAADVYADAGGSAAGTAWWLDVETTAPWQTDSDGPALNAQVVSGALTYLQGRGVEVGLYSTGEQWASLIGTSSGFTSLPEWYADGGVSGLQLALDCATPFAAGRVTQVQDIGTGSALDHDLRC